jgi:hypothetical protein
MLVHLSLAPHSGHHEQYSPFQSAMCKRWDTPQFYAFQNRGHGMTLVHTATREFCNVLRHFIRTGSLPLSASPTA